MQHGKMMRCVKEGEEKCAIPTKILPSSASCSADVLLAALCQCRHPGSCHKGAFVVDRIGFVQEWVPSCTKYII